MKIKIKLKPVFIKDQETPVYYEPVDVISEIKYLTEHERKSYNCSDLLPPPGNEVALEHLRTINKLRKLLVKMAGYSFSNIEGMPNWNKKIKKHLKGTSWQ